MKHENDQLLANLANVFIDSTSTIIRQLIYNEILAIQKSLFVIMNNLVEGSSDFVILPLNQEEVGYIYIYVILLYQLVKMFI